MEEGDENEESFSQNVDDVEIGPGAFAVGRHSGVRFRASAVEDNYTLVTASLQEGGALPNRDMTRFLSGFSADDNAAKRRVRNGEHGTWHPPP